MKFFKRLILVLSYGPEIDKVLEEKREEEELRIFREKRDRLKLCFRHQEENPGTHYAEHNCDHCKLENRYANLMAKKGAS